MTEFIDYRVRFKKGGDAKYISHLDLTRCVQRALKRSKLPVWHTEGFNPHPYVSFPLPLPLGQSSEGEILDFRLTENVSRGEVLKRLKDVLPDTLEPVSVFSPVNKVKFIERAKYKIVFPMGAQGLEGVAKLLSEKPLTVTKTTKSKEQKEIDLAPFIYECEIKCTLDKSLVLNIILPAGSQNNINPALLTDKINAEVYSGDMCPQITRTEILKSDNTLFD